MVMKKAVVRFVVEVQAKGFPKAFLSKKTKAGGRPRTFKTRATAMKAMKTLKDKLEFEFVTKSGRVTKLKRQMLQMKVKRILVKF